METHLWDQPNGDLAKARTPRQPMSVMLPWLPTKQPFVSTRLRIKFHDWLVKYVGISSPARGDDADLSKWLCSFKPACNHLADTCGHLDQQDAIVSVVCVARFNRYYVEEQVNRWIESHHVLVHI